MSRQTFNPKSRQQNEREIIRLQNDFSNGLYKDITKIPDNAIVGLRDFTNRGSELETRVGSRHWGDWVNLIPSANFPIDITLGKVARNNISITKSNYTVTAPASTFTVNDIKKFILYNDGTNEQIIKYLSDTQVYVDSNTIRNAQNINIIGCINGFYKHKQSGKFYLHIGSELYVADNEYMTSWSLCFNNSIEVLDSNTVSQFDEYNQYLIIINTNGFFKLNTTDNYKIYYKINSSNPTIKITNQGASTENPEEASSPTTSTIGHKYIYSMSKLNGINAFINRQSSGIYIEQESGTNKIDSNGIDYGAIWSSNTVTLNVLSTLTNPTILTKQQQHWTHYSIYSTKDIGPEGTDPVFGEGNNKEIFVWMQDIPLIKCFVGTISSNTYTLSSGTFNRYDTGSIINFKDGQTATIQTLIDEHNAVLTTVTNASSIEGVIGASKNTTSKIDTYYHGTLQTTSSIFSSTDIGKTIFCSDGKILHIASVVSNNTITILETDIGSISGTSISFDAIGRSYQVDFEDSTLDSRINQYYTCNHRFWTPLPDCNKGIISNGFLICCNEGEGIYYYSQLARGFEYRIGNYYSPFQYDNLKDSLLFITNHTDSVVFWCKSSRWKLNTTLINNVLLDKIGVQYSILDQKILISGSISSHDSGSWCYLPENNTVFFITNEPGIRVFDGKSDTDNLVVNRNIKLLKTIGNTFTCSYDPINGIVVWYKDSQMYLGLDSFSTKSTKCFRYGFDTQHGFGLSDITETYYPMPEINSGTLSFIDSTGVFRHLIVDSNNFNIYNISLFEGTELTGDTLLWTDKNTVSGTSGYNYKPLIKFKEDIGEYEKFYIRSLSENIYFRPYSEEDGYPDNLSLNLNKYKDGNVSIPDSIIQNISLPKNELFFDKTIDNCHRLQTELIANKAPFKVVARQMEYVVYDKKDNPDDRKTTEDEIQEKLTTSIASIKRGYLPIKLIGDKAVLTVSNEDEVLLDTTAYFDGYPNSVLSLGNTTINISVPANTENTNLTMIYYLNDPTLNISSYIEGYESLGYCYPYINQDTHWIVVVYRTTSSSLVNFNYSGDSMTPVKLFAFNAFNSLLMDNEIDYYINDIFYNNGNNVLGYF